MPYSAIRRVTAHVLRVCSLLLLSGCAALLAGGATGTFEGLQYSWNNVARKTFTTQAQVLQDACVQALEEMGIESSGPARTSAGFRIAALTPKLEIEIEIERVTERASQIRVNAKKGLWRKDLATASEIIRRTEIVMNRSASDFALRSRPPAQ